MGIYIKGMEKPEKCTSCYFNESDVRCGITKGLIDRDDGTCMVECPIVEIKDGQGKWYVRQVVRKNFDWDWPRDWPHKYL